MTAVALGWLIIVAGILVAYWLVTGRTPLWMELKRREAPMALAVRLAGTRAQRRLLNQVLAARKAANAELRGCKAGPLAAAVYGLHEVLGHDLWVICGLGDGERRRAASCAARQAELRPRPGCSCLRSAVGGRMVIRKVSPDCWAHGQVLPRTAGPAAVAETARTEYSAGISLTLRVHRTVRHRPVAGPEALAAARGRLHEAPLLPGRVVMGPGHSAHWEDGS
jgi:hypothetical protein